MTAVGLEPTHPKIMELGSTALDDAATLHALLTDVPTLQASVFTTCAVFEILSLIAACG